MTPGHSSKPEAANEVAEIFSRNESSQLMQQINLRLSPASGAYAIRSSWVEQMAGDEGAAQEVLRRCADRGVPLPFDVE